MLRTMLLATLAVAVLFAEGAAQTIDYNTRVTLATYRISGPSQSKPGLSVIGSSFLVAVPAEGNPNQPWGVLVTAKHVLSEITGSVLRET